MMAVLNMLAADACVSPKGDLIVAAHSGLPDWGSGPKGKGKLYKIALADRDAPQPVLAWASGPQEVRIAFDRPLDPAELRSLAKSASIEHGLAVRPGDRFESLRPGYEVVGRQMAAPRYELPILSAGVSADRRTLLLTTAPHPEAASYALTLPSSARPGASKDRPGLLPQVAETDLGYDLSGVAATWRPEVGEVAWSGWLPHLDLTVARAFTAGSAEHDRLWEAIGRPGRLTLKAKLDLWQMLRPAVQTGSDPGYRLPDEEVTLAIAGAGLEVTVQTPARGHVRGSALAGQDGRYSASRSSRRDPEGAACSLLVEIEMTTGRLAAAVEVSWTTREDATPRALPLRRVLLPWAPLEKRAEAIAERTIPELKGGDWARGRTVFYGEQAKCSACHRVRGRGGEIGPDLSNSIHRDLASVHRDIHAPSAAINPDYIAHSVALVDGRVLQGTLRTESDRLVVGDTDGRRTVIHRAEVEATTPTSVSIMPEGLDTALGSDKLRDLLTFLLTDPLGPAKLEHDGAPPPRRRSELDAVLKGGAAVENPRRLRIVLSGGPKDPAGPPRGTTIPSGSGGGRPCSRPTRTSRSRRPTAGLPPVSLMPRIWSCSIPTTPAGTRRWPGSWTASSTGVPASS